ncbi:hypothetical protein PR202_ga07207 [Eleusine coracana subsp. coracana]|uniref:Uncharacterized protein n=1 Tax=Eleusine coracana subsp. coracana TaxID=191504 RepID=A0AAV5BWV8_ELECO|nr:hypothetical protein QOZ80_2AG0109550 [Eleusine coracana subsp. coracana]GJM90884.1 hypothetical protein PR202_ga07207 [Eleusine coracana subsp. coracana]
MDYWKSKVLPKMRLIFVKTGGKKAAAATEVIKALDESKEGINGEFEEKKADLQPKVIEIYESVPAPVKILIKERKKTSAIKKNSAAIIKLFEDLAKIEFPGAKQLSEGITKVGPALLSGPIFSTFKKISTLLPVAVEETPKEAPAATEEKKEEAAAEEKKEETAATEEKKEDAAEEKKEEATAAAEEAAPVAAAADPVAEETSAAPAEAAPEAAAPAEPESAPAKAEETPKAA